MSRNGWASSRPFSTTRMLPPRARLGRTGGGVSAGGEVTYGGAEVAGRPGPRHARGRDLRRAASGRQGRQSAAVRARACEPPSPAPQPAATASSRRRRLRERARTFWRARGWQAPKVDPFASAGDGVVIAHPPAPSHERLVGLLRRASRRPRRTRAARAPRSPPAWSDHLVHELGVLVGEVRRPSVELPSASEVNSISFFDAPFFAMQRNIISYSPPAVASPRRDHRLPRRPARRARLRGLRP